MGESIYQSSRENPVNTKYYQSFHAFFNETSVYGIPFFMSKHYFLNSSSNWTTFIDIFDERNNLLDLAEEEKFVDDSFVVVEPYSGVSFQSTLNLQANYYYQPD